MPSIGSLSKQRLEIAAMLQRFDCSGDDLAAKSRELTLMMLAESEYPFSRRQFTPGHITCTAVVRDPRRERVLLMFHHRLLRWLLPGGHCENDDLSISGVAGREAVEETGVAIDQSLAAPLVGMDVHGIPPKKKEPYHLHHDLIFAFTAQLDAVRVTAEARQVEWCLPADLDRFGVAPSIVRSEPCYKNRMHVSPISIDTLNTHIDYDIWANRRILDAVGALTPEELTRDFGSADKSILGTLLHVYGADVVWIERVHGTSLTERPYDDQATLATLQAAWPPGQASGFIRALGKTPPVLDPMHYYRQP